MQLGWVWTPAYLRLSSPPHPASTVTSCPSSTSSTCGSCLKTCVTLTQQQQRKNKTATTTQQATTESNKQTKFRALRYSLENRVGQVGGRDVKLQTGLERRVIFFTDACNPPKNQNRGGEGCVCARVQSSSTIEVNPTAPRATREFIAKHTFLYDWS